MYVELDHELVPRKIEDVIKRDGLQEHGREAKTQSGYDIGHKNMQAVLREFDKQRQVEKTLKSQESANDMSVAARSTQPQYLRLCWCCSNMSANKTQKTESMKKVEIKEYEAVIGPNEEIFFDHDWGFFGAIVACYNNHWVLKTSPDDWWNVIVRNVAQVVDEKGDLPNVRSFFVDHEGKKTIAVGVPSMEGTDYSWLFDQFSAQIKKNIKTPGYVDVVQADFSTTTPTQLVATQIMLMASVQKYFEYLYFAACGIPGIEMTGTQEDWEKLVEKLDGIETLLQPIMKDLELEKWFGIARKVVSNLLDTYRGQPDKEWWGHILCWNVRHGSGASMEWWSGWMTEFLMATRNPSKPKNFPRGVVSVPITFNDHGLEDTGVLVAGTVGFTIEEGERAPIVMAKQGWSILMPQGSPITPRLLAK